MFERKKKGMQRIEEVNLKTSAKGLYLIL